MLFFEITSRFGVNRITRDKRFYQIERIKMLRDDAVVRAYRLSAALESGHLPLI